MIILRRSKLDFNSFDHEDLYHFITYCGREMYTDPKFSSVKDNEDIKNYCSKSNKFKESVLKRKVDIILPMNHKKYDSTGMFRMYDKNEKYWEGLDIMALVTDGLIVFSEAPIYLPLAATLTKYWTPSCGWNYRYFRLSPQKPPYPVITIPEKDKDWDTLLKALTEFLVIYRLSYGVEPRIHFYKKPAEKVEEKKYSELASFIPTAAILGSSLIIAPLVKKQLHLKLQDTNKNYNSGFVQKFKRYITKTYPDIEIVNLGLGSCYINPRNIQPEVIEEVKKAPGLRGGDPKRLRTMLDYIVWGYENGKHLIFCYDLDNPLALCHEVGHYLIEKEQGTAGWLQNNSKRGLTNPGFIKFIGFVLGLTGSIGEIAGVVSTLLLKSPQLYTEFLASYKGLEVLKAAGGTEKEIEEAKKMFKLAWGTYLCGTVSLTRASSFSKLGRLGFNKFR